MLSSQNASKAMSRPNTAQLRKEVVSMGRRKSKNAKAAKKNQDSPQKGKAGRRKRGKK